MLVDADPQNVVAESNKSNNTASFRTYVIGVVTHGGIQTTVAGADGAWSLSVPRPVAAGRYDVVAHASRPVGPTGRTIHMTPTARLPTLAIPRSPSH